MLLRTPTRPRHGLAFNRVHPYGSKCQHFPIFQLLACGRVSCSSESVTRAYSPTRACLKNRLDPEPPTATVSDALLFLDTSTSTLRLHSVHAKENEATRIQVATARPNTPIPPHRAPVRADWGDHRYDKSKRQPRQQYHDPHNTKLPHTARMLVPWTGLHEKRCSRDRPPRSKTPDLHTDKRIDFVEAASRKISDIRLKSRKYWIPGMPQ